MRWAREILGAIGLSLLAVAAPAQEPAAPTPSAQNEDAKPQTQEAAKGAASSTKGETSEKTKDEDKEKSKDSSGSTDKTETQTGDKPQAAAEGLAGPKTVETKAPGKTGSDPEKAAASEPGASPALSEELSGYADFDAATEDAGSAEKSRENPAPAPMVPALQKAPRKIVVRQGGASEPATHIAPGMTVAEASSERQEAEKLLSAAEEDLRRVLGRVLDAQQEETVSQIHNYVGRARAALKEGDTSRGHTLAMKANLLADDLVKH